MMSRKATTLSECHICIYPFSLILVLCSCSHSRSRAWCWSYPSAYTHQPVIIGYPHMQASVGRYSTRQDTCI
ncbi:hypothetical protein F4821DRAFT_228528 [Hypoxylon rubiginosum]|uniref:Uncharacterized protein n=1 Tax=Hypoxylon rubiginosum TaxID=110542 RepID=A0ACC0DCT2_9PEZI|nr:hypothetical protein F4821DRAFT_228528 [Hypoxylon rubiginosum]